MEHLTFLEAKKYANVQQEGMRHRRLAVLGDFATQHFCLALRGTAAYRNVALEIYEAGYKQIELQLLDEHSETYQFLPDEILICMCSEVLYRSYCRVAYAERTAFAEMQYEKIRQCWESAAQYSKSTVLQTTFLELDDRTFGNYGSKMEHSFIFQLRKLNYLLTSAAAQLKYVNIVDMSYIRMFFSDQELRDPKMYCIAKLPYTLPVLPAMAELVLSVIYAHMGQIKKCVVLDLDNTLWGGVVGDDGTDKIQIGEFGTGQAFSEFQYWLKELKRRGILLAVCSKNEEEIAKEPFRSNPSMVLRLEDISLFYANWEDKTKNIQRIQESLGIGMDSIVFFDDNPFEREAVRQMLPEVIVPELPKDPALYVPYLRELNLFETASFSEEDGNRTQQYRTEMERRETQQRFQSFEEYLGSLTMRAKTKRFDEYHIPRIAQLSQRSNQFNLRTVRYSEEDIRRIAFDSSYIALYFTLKDRFGDYGLVSAVVLKKEDTSTLFIENWFMSCRVLKRGMEEFILNAVVKTALDFGFQTIVGEYIPTEKNGLVHSIYPQSGFSKTERANVYSLKLESFVPLATQITESEESVKKDDESRRNIGDCQ